MPLQTELAIIIRTQDLAGADRLVTCLASHEGRLRLVAKNARKSQRRFANCLEPLSLVKISYIAKPQQELGRLERGELVTDFRELRQYLAALAAALAVAEIAVELGGAVDRVTEIFQLLRLTLVSLSPGQAWESLFLSHLVPLLALAGYGLNWEECRRCRQPPGGLAWFSLEAAGLLCSACVGPGDSARLWPVHAGTRKLLLLARRQPWEKLARLRFPPLAAAEAWAIFRRFVPLLLGRDLKTLDFLSRFWRPQE